jgi:hypothetical protein
VGWKLVEGFPYKNGRNSRASLLTGSTRTQTVDESLRVRPLIGPFQQFGASSPVARRCNISATTTRRCVVAPNGRVGSVRRCFISVRTKRLASEFWGL